MELEFYEDDEPVEKVQQAFAEGDQGTTQPHGSYSVFLESLEVDITVPPFLRWFHKAAKRIEVLRENPGEGWRVWVSNGLGGHAWAGSSIAYCTSRADADLVALGLRTLMEQGQHTPVVHDEKHDE